MWDYQSSKEGPAVAGALLLIKPDVRISRIRLTEGVSSEGTRRLSDHYEASLIPDNDKGARTNCDPRLDDNHVDFDDAGECSGAETPDSLLRLAPAEDDRSQSIGPIPPADN